MVMELIFQRGLTPQSSLLANAHGGGEIAFLPFATQPPGCWEEGMLRRVGVWWGGKEQAANWPSAECKHRAECFCIAARNNDSFDFNFDVSIFLMTH